jgi:hypothetical protein
MIALLISRLFDNEEKYTVSGMMGNLTSKDGKCAAKDIRQHKEMRREETQTISEVLKSWSMKNCPREL